MIRRLFTDHPDSVGETYAEHFVAAGRFGLAMVIGGTACMIHAVLPFAFETKGSETIAELHRRMVAKRGAARSAQTQMKTVEYII
jgi:hypothetical protein